MTQTWTFLMYRYNFYVNPIQRNQEKKSSWKKYSQSIHDMFHFEKKTKTTNPQLSRPHTWRKQSILQIHIAVVFDCESFIHIMSHITHQYTYTFIHTSASIVQISTAYQNQTSLRSPKLAISRFFSLFMRFRNT